MGPDHRIYAGNHTGQIVAINPVTGGTAMLGARILSGAIYGTTVSGSGVIYASGGYPSMADVRMMDLTGTSLGSIASPGGTNLKSTGFGPDGSFYLPRLWRRSGAAVAPGFVYDAAFGGGGLSGAFGVGTRANGEVIVTGQNLAAYFRFSREGAYLGSVSVNCAGQLRNLAVDPNDNVWVGCYGESAVVKFNAQDVRGHPAHRQVSPSGVAFERP